MIRLRAAQSPVRCISTLGLKPIKAVLVVSHGALKAGLHIWHGPLHPTAKRFSPSTLQPNWAEPPGSPRLPEITPVQPRTILKF